MGRKVKLTWRRSNGKKEKEVCTLLSEEDKHRLVVPIGDVQVDDEVDMWDYFVSQGLVLFHSEADGIFGLHAEQIIKIKEMK